MTTHHRQHSTVPTTITVSILGGPAAYTAPTHRAWYILRRYGVTERSARSMAERAAEITGTDFWQWATFDPLSLAVVIAASELDDDEREAVAYTVDRDREHKAAVVSRETAADGR